MAHGHRSRPSDRRSCTPLSFIKAHPGRPPPERGRSCDVSAVRKTLRSRLQDWRERLREHPEQARVMVRELIVGRLDFRPNPDEGYYEFRGVGTLQPLIAGFVPHKVASPNELTPYYLTARLAA